MRCPSKSEFSKREIEIRVAVVSLRASPPLGHYGIAMSTTWASSHDRKRRSPTFGPKAKELAMRVSWAGSGELSSWLFSGVLGVGMLV